MATLDNAVSNGCRNTGGRMNVMEGVGGRVMRGPDWKWVKQDGI